MSKPVHEVKAAAVHVLRGGQWSPLSPPGALGIRFGIYTGGPGAPERMCRIVATSSDKSVIINEWLPANKSETQLSKLGELFISLTLRASAPADKRATYGVQFVPEDAELSAALYEALTRVMLGDFSSDGGPNVSCGATTSTVPSEDRKAGRVPAGMARNPRFAAQIAAHARDNHGDDDQDKDSAYKASTNLPPPSNPLPAASASISAPFSAIRPPLKAVALPPRKAPATAANVKTTNEGRTTAMTSEMSSATINAQHTDSISTSVLPPPVDTAISNHLPPPVDLSTLPPPMSTTDLPPPVNFDELPPPPVESETAVADHTAADHQFLRAGGRTVVSGSSTVSAATSGRERPGLSRAATLAFGGHQKQTLFARSSSDLQTARTVDDSEISVAVPPDFKPKSRPATLRNILERQPSSQEVKALALSRTRTFNTLHVEKIRGHYKTMRVAKSNKAFKEQVARMEKNGGIFEFSNAKLGESKRASLNTVATECEEQVVDMMKFVNSCVTDSTKQFEADLKRKLSIICEGLQMLLILTQQTEMDVVVGQLIQDLSGRLGVWSDHKVIDKVTVQAAQDLQTGQLVRAALIKRIYSELVSVKNLSVQLTCIIRYIANIDVDYVALIQMFATIKGFTVGIGNMVDGLYTLQHLDQHVFDTVSHHCAAATLEAGDSIWSETVAIDTIAQNAESLRLGNLNQLIIKLTCPPTSKDERFLKIFMRTFRSFVSPKLLLFKLKERTDIPANIRDIERIQILKRVGLVLKVWIEQSIEDFDDDMVASLDHFIELFDSHPLTASMSDALFSLVTERIESLKRERLLWFQRDAERFTILEEGISLADLLLEMPTPMIAQQMTLIEWSIYLSVQPTELLSQSWNKDTLKYRAPNVVSLITRSTRVSHWTAAMILGQDDVTYRAKMFEKMIDICIQLRDMRNFNTLMGIVAGMNMASILRLAKAKKKVDKTRAKAFKSIMKLLSPEGSHSAYRKHLNTLAAPVLPYFGLSLMDLTFIEDGNPDEMDGMLNFKKREMLSDSIHQLLRFQHEKPYQIQALEPLYTFLEEMPLLDEKELYSLSLLIEPRDPSGEKSSKRESKF